MSDIQPKRKIGAAAWILFFVVAIVVFIAGMFFSSIVERKAETVSRLQITKELPEWEPRNEIWGINFPREYESWRLTLDTGFRSKYAGSKLIDYLEESPNLVIL